MNSFNPIKWLYYCLDYWWRNWGAKWLVTSLKLCSGEIRMHTQAVWVQNVRCDLKGSWDMLVTALGLQQNVGRGNLPLLCVSLDKLLGYANSAKSWLLTPITWATPQGCVAVNSFDSKRMSPPRHRAAYLSAPFLSLTQLTQCTGSIVTFYIILMKLVGHVNKTHTNTKVWLMFLLWIVKSFVIDPGRNLLPSTSIYEK